MYYPNLRPNQTHPLGLVKENTGFDLHFKELKDAGRRFPIISTRVSSFSLALEVEVLITRWSTETQTSIT